MRKLLEETLYGGEVYGLYSKVDSCEMFGYSMSSGFGSGIGGNGSGFGKGNAPNSITKSSCGFGFRYRADEHEDYGRDHVNLDILNPINPNKTLQKIHINWKKY